MVKFSLHQFFSDSMFVQSQKGEVFGHLLLKSLGVDLWESATYSRFFSDLEKSESGLRQKVRALTLGQPKPPTPPPPPAATGPVATQ